MEIAVIVAIGVILYALLFAPGQSAADGGFNLQVSMDGPSSDEIQIRFARVYRHRLNSGMTEKELEQLNWYPVAELTFPLIVGVEYSIYSRFNAFYERSKFVCPDGILVEYTEANEPSRYRVVPIERRRGQGVVEVTVPREPPTDDEAWTPE